MLGIASLIEQCTVRREKKGRGLVHRSPSSAETSWLRHLTRMFSSTHHQLAHLITKQKTSELTGNLAAPLHRFGF
jgi:hypothetical protein